jgi:dTDP-4-dehydrorhamnose 3,5-epimerase
MSDFKVEIIESKVFPEVKILKPDPFFDYRGEMWTFWEKENEILPIRHEWKISKFTRSRKNVLRGLHGDNVTWKNITCVWGEIYLVVVDNRPDSVNYLKWESYIISERNHLSVLVPPNFVNAHLCLSEECLFHYTQAYPHEYVDWMDQDTLKWNDERINIEWPIKNPILNWRDK